MYCYLLKLRLHLRLWATSSSYAWGQRWTKVESEPWEIKAVRENLTSRFKESLIKSKEGPRKEVEFFYLTFRIWCYHQKDSFFLLPKNFKDLKSIQIVNRTSSNYIRISRSLLTSIFFLLLNQKMIRNSKTKIVKLVAHEK